MSALSILAEECELINDSKYRTYITQVEKALKSFDSTSEWADLISALGKLNKVLLAHVKFPVVPKRVTIGKRLAQCLHPALPSGVHMKALETYDIIFKCIGTERLSQDLFIYSAGLFPLLSHAAMNVKPVLLKLYEQHFIKLGQRVKPGLNGLLLGLLPGLEEGSDYYDKTNELMEDFCVCTEPSYFYTCLWECVHSCPSIRLPAITFLLTHFNKKKTMEDQLHMMGLNINLMVEAVCDAVQDTSVLVQRSLLDFLLLAFPLHNSQLTHSDMADVVKASINVLLRRDMSLNRRLYAWLLGTSATSAQLLELKSKGDKSPDVEAEVSYFEKYSKELLIQALKFKLSEKMDMNGGGSLKTAMLKPFRILISLLDKPEIGPVILENVLLSIFRCLHREFQISKEHDSNQQDKRNKAGASEKSSAYDELLKTANLLFGTFEPSFIWDYISRMYDQSCAGTSSGKVSRQGSMLSRQGSTVSRQVSLQDKVDMVSITELCLLVSFLLDIVSLETLSETQTEHLPRLLLNVISSLTENCDRLSDDDISTSLQLCTSILSKVQPTMTIPESHDLPLAHDSSQGQLDMVEVATNKDVIGETVPVTMTMEEAIEANKKLKSEAAADTTEPSVDTSQDTKLQHTEEPSSEKSGQNQNPEPAVADANRSKLPGSRKHSRQNPSASLMQKCIDCFQNFFHTFVVHKLIKDENCLVRCMQSMIRQEADVCGSFERDSCIDSGSEFSCDDKLDGDDGLHPDADIKISMSHVKEESLKTFSSCCQLLIDFASFPMYGQDVLVPRNQSSPGSSSLPEWVQDLVLCCCFVENFPMQSSAISTMLDLIILTQSVHVESQSASTLSGQQPKAVNILPTLHHCDLKFLEENTYFHKLAARVLWGYLGDETPQHHHLTVKLFHILHQVAPSAWICENVIGSQLIRENESVRIEAFKKFTVLWHLTRNRKTGVIPGKPLRAFDRSMFVVLDCLKEEGSPVKTIASTWLTHIIQQGDISRVMEPLLLMLLHPDTARVSVQHVNIHKPRKVCISESSEDPEANIYAISSEGGNIIYHVSAAKKEALKKKTEDMKSYSLMVLSERGNCQAPARSRSEQELHCDNMDASSHKMRMNPFGSESSLDNLIFGGYEFPASYKEQMYARAKRLDKESCIKEGTDFVENEDSTQGEETEDEQRADDARSKMSNSTDSVMDSADEAARTVINGILEDITKEESKALDNLRGSPRKTPIPLTLRSESVTSSNMGDHDLLNSVNNEASGIDSPTPSEQNASMFHDGGQSQVKDSTDIHTLHMHMLLYTQKYDYERTLYALSTLKSILMTCPRLMVTSLVTTNISTLRTVQLANLQLLLARHRKSVFGKNFFGEIPADVMSNYRSSMFIEILISVCLYFIRGYYPNLMMSKLSHGDLLGNKKVHIVATETLTLMVSEVVNIMRDSGKNFVSYISDLLQRCKVQKALLHCMMAVIFNARKKKEKELITSKFTEGVVSFNEESLGATANETFQIKLLNLLLALIMLEDQIRSCNVGSDNNPPIEWDRLKVSYQPSLNNVRYNMGHPIVQQGMFVSSVLSALKQSHMCHMHRHWVALVTTALPYMGKYLPGIVMPVVSQICRNIEAIATEYEADAKTSDSSSLEKLPPDHLVTMLDGLMTLCHYCLLDNVSPVAIGQPSANTVTSPAAMTTTNILSSLFHVFNPIGNSRESSPQRDSGAVSPVIDARNNILSVLPRIIACMASLWRAISIVEKHEEAATLTLGAPKVVRQYILEFISPISRPHGAHLLGAVAVAWNDRRKHFKQHRKVVPPACEDQLLLVDLVSAIKVLPLDTLIQTVKQVLKQPPSSELSRTKKHVPLEINMLQFFYAYVQQTSASQLVDSWSALLVLLREALQLNMLPPGQFLLLLILNEFVQKTPPMDKKNQKDVQEIAQRLLEAISNIAGSSLEQTTWLRKNFAVKPGPQSDEPEHEHGQQPAGGDSVVTERRVADPEPSTTSSVESKYSVQALSLLAELTAPMLDVIYSSEEKDKVAPFLNTILYNVFPYLKNHSSHNLPSLRAASQLLSSISSYQYTRKAWRREAFEMLLDPSFFLMDTACVTYWLAIVDNLMTHDKTTYKDLMARVSVTQTGSLNLFSNKEQEIDQKASMLKRLAFTIFCSEPDQYQKSIPEIQEKLAESLRVLQAPAVMAHVFLCFRVLMLRISPQHLTSMWPTIITELIHVFLQMEQELSSETEEFLKDYFKDFISQEGMRVDPDSGMARFFTSEKDARLFIERHLKLQVQRIAALDSSWAHLGNGLNAHTNPSWLQLYLSACKLLDMCLALPADRVPQFQLYRWAFIGGAAAGEGEEEEPEEEDDAAAKKRKDLARKKTSFKPHIIRLAKLLNTKLQGDVPVLKMVPGRPLLTSTHLRSLNELQPFFNTLCLANQTDNILLAACQLGNMKKSMSAALANGHAEPKTVSQSERVASRGISKSKSAPSFDLSQGVNADNSATLQVKTNKQYVEEVLKRDFLEPMH